MTYYSTLLQQLPQELPSFSLSCLHPSQCGLDHPPNRTGPDCNQQSGLQRGSSGLTFPPSRTYKSGKGHLTSLQTPHILHTNCLEFYLQVALQRQLLPPGCFSVEHLIENQTTSY
ncbi:hypothetical protein CHARACLAT_029898 [Characodon lateralis]|uniref:Uncharacterized protein n=1 Tax=Characodon lateralis TaxID=208331 RepID=A0ABU7D4R2_9TELE|nr:hypothetical protein [Characodon lateralis]